MFQLDPAFLGASEPLTTLALCEARLHADARFPWIILVPRRAGAVELEDLTDPDRADLMSEILLAGGATRAIGKVLGRPVAKLNVGQLGNITRQLHVHVVGRRADDAAWPGPVWGAGLAEAYGELELALAKTAALAALKP